jgi:prepilin-type N-terminal cleavage/methylation domain-containing protein
MNRGFTLIEMAVALVILLAVTGALFDLLNPARGAFQSRLEAIDMHQRLRVSVDALTRDLSMGGAGGGKYFAAILPYRRGPLAPDPAGSYFADRISIVYVPAAAWETSLSLPADGGPAMTVHPQGGCPAGRPLCGFEVNGLAAIFDETGFYDTFRIAAVQDDPPTLVRTAGTLAKAYGAGATVVPLNSATYWMRTDARSGAPQLMKYDGQQTDLPIADHVLDLRFDYFGDATPPVIRRPLSDAAGPWTSYGPKPPDVNEDDPSTPAYGAGENCVFAVVDGTTVTRAEMSDLGSGVASLVSLDARVLTDGPWCPDPAAPDRFDADLLRVRKVRATLRVRPWRVFSRPLDDERITFEVTPRNLSLPQ